MDTTTIKLETDRETQAAAEKVAKDLGFGTLATLINAFLRQVARTKKARGNLEEEPTKHLLTELKRSEEDYKAGRFISFDSGEDALKYVSSLIKDERYKRP
jgi:antitoxin component of RelBE/YafQ-DinJ toxin-antitoxin module